MTDLYSIPGTMCDERLWLPLQNALNGVELHHQAIPMAATLDEIVSELAQSLPNKAINLLGFSMGGYLAAAFAVRFPKRVKRLVLLSNLASGLPEAEKQQRLVALNWVRKRGYSGIPLKKAQAMLGKQARQNEHLLALIQEMDKSLGEEVFLQQLSASLERPDLSSELQQSSIMPTVVAGSEDILLAEQDKQRIRQLAQSHYIEIAQAGHMLPLECPQQIAKIIERTLLKA